MITTAAEVLTQQPITMKTCRQCAAQFSPPLEYPYAAQFVKVCPECCEKQTRAENARDVQAAQNRLLNVWKKLCPPDFLTTDPRKLPRPHLLKPVLAWRYGARGLLLHGPTGTGKSRCAWLLLKREHGAGKYIRVIDHSVGFEYGQRFANSPADAAVWIEKLSGADILFLDDVFKAKLTDSLEQALFTIISARCEHGRPNIVTCNDTSDSLLERLSPDRGAALVRRLVEYAERLPFI